jgi:hypothetical protein
MIRNQIYLLTKKCVCDFTGNVALGKSTYQDGHYGTMTSDKAVDGNRGLTNKDVHCAHPLNDNTVNTVSWTVDLGSLNRIYNVTVYNTIDGGGSYIYNSFYIHVYFFEEGCALDIFGVT